jgi:hypothetical protein
MQFTEYLSFVGKKLEEAAERGDKEEWVRLGTILIEVVQEEIKKLQTKP